MSAFDSLSQQLHHAVRETKLLRSRGRVTQVLGTIIKAQVPDVETGELCYLVNPSKTKQPQTASDATQETATDQPMLAEVVGFAKGEALLTPMGNVHGISNATEVIPTGQPHQVGVGKQLLGRVLDGLGNPLDSDEKGPLPIEGYYPVYADAPDPLQRRLIEQPLNLGIRAIDGFLTCGEGQRMGIFAAAGGGKSTLLSMLVKEADVDVRVIALIGERGREVREFIDRDLGPEGLAKSVIIVTTSDRPAMERVKAAYVATAIAEFYRDQGKKVLFLMDSVTRFARAQREIGLAAGEPPTRRGFPPSVFAALPRLMERAGNNDKGSMTGLYTVLVEGDDMTEPVADEVRSILDGHIILSRKLATANHYPAIDVLASISRVMNSVVDREQLQQTARLRQLMAKYDEVELLVKMGEYKEGSDHIADEAIARIDEINAFLRQAVDEHCSAEKTRRLLLAI